MMSDEYSDHSINLMLVVANAARRIEREECARIADRGESPKKIADEIRARKHGE
jgi:hypothetical protein